MVEQGRLHTMVFHSLEDRIVVIDRAGVIVDVNAAWTAFGRENGLSEAFVAVGSNYLSVLAASRASGDLLAAEAAGGISAVLEGRRSSFYHEYPCHSPGQQRWFMMRVAALRESDGKLFVISHHDITQRRLAEERAEYLAWHDPLTGLANRRRFSDFLRHELRRSLRSRSALSLLEFDVDHFKEYNDEFGHPAGDKCLVEVGRILRSRARRPDDLAARLGGDEFALILGETDLGALRKIAEAIRKAVDDLAMVYGGGSKRVTLSVGGVSVIPQQHHTGELLLEAADRALYRAKTAGRNRTVLEGEPG